MLSNSEESTILKAVYKYIDDLQYEGTVLCQNDEITESSPQQVSVISRQYLIDPEMEYEVLIRHPVEPQFFIPKTVDCFVTQIDVSIDRTGNFEITDFNDLGVVDEESIPLIDPRVSDECLSVLVNAMCFDVGYQKWEKDVTAVIRDFYSTPGSPEVEGIKSRLAPFLGVTENSV